MVFNARWFSAIPTAITRSPPPCLRLLLPPPHLRPSVFRVRLSEWSAIHLMHWCRMKHIHVCNTSEGMPSKHVVYRRSAWKQSIYGSLSIQFCAGNSKVMGREVDWSLTVILLRVEAHSSTSIPL